MAEFLLVPGAWLGAWAWDDVVPELRAAGHGAHPLTLSGLADKQGVPAGQQTHVEDIVGEVTRLDLHDVVLVGHSYAGIPAGQAAELIGDRLARVVFVDANVPADGVAFAAGPYAQLMADALAANDGFWAPADAERLAGNGLSDEQIARIRARATPQPGATLTEPAKLPRPLGELPVTYVKCLLAGAEPTPDVAELLRSPGWRLVELDTGHWPMFSRPHELARILLDEAVRAPGR